MKYRAICSLLAGIAIAMTAGYASADSAPIRIKDWTYQDLGGGAYLGATTNESGSAFGVTCVGTGKCIAFLSTDTGCKPSSTYSVLVSSDTGANAFDVTCANISSAGEKPRYALYFNDFKDMLNRILKDHSIGFAIAMAGGQFKVCRFSLEGSNEVVAAITRAEQSKVTNQPASTGDQIL